MINLKLAYNDDGSATLDTKNTIYEDYNINIVEILAYIFRDRDETKYCFSMCLKTTNCPTYDYTWEISLKPTKVANITSFLSGTIKQEGKQITCTNF